MGSGGVRIEIEKCDGSHFDLWKMKMEDLLVDRDLWSAIEDERPVISETSSSSKESESAIAEWDKSNRKAKGLIRLFLTDSILTNVMEETSARSLWRKLESLYQSKSLVNKLLLWKKWYNSACTKEIRFRSISQSSTLWWANSYPSERRFLTRIGQLRCYVHCRILGIISLWLLAEVGTRSYPTNQFVLLSYLRRLGEEDLRRPAKVLWLHQGEDLLREMVEAEKDLGANPSLGPRAGI